MTTKSILIGITACSLMATSGSSLADASASHGNSKPQGIYSADQLMDADVYSQNNPQQEIGEIEDVLLDNNMSIKSFVVETEGKFGLGGKSYVVPTNQIKVETLDSDRASKPHYHVTIGVDKQQLASYPVYSDSWFHKAQNQTQQAWQQTKQTASTAWNKFKNTTTNLVNGTQNAADTAGNKVNSAADTATDKAGNAADQVGDAASSAAHKTQNATQNATDKAGNAADQVGDAASNAAHKTQNAAQNASDNN